MLGIKIVFWYWWALAAVLLVAEMTLPGVVFLFLAVGAGAAGLALLIWSGTSLEIQLLIFAVVAAASAVVLRPFLKRLQHIDDDAGESSLNVRAGALVGRTFVLDQPLLRGRGRVKLGDGSWSITGPDMAAGTRVRVAAVDGTELRVEPAP
jgi:membrane protein implicated in regulation of membrane protease activity